MGWRVREAGARPRRKGGRDHNPKGFTYFLAGGGIKGGTSYGETDELGHEAAVNRHHIRDLHATILHQMGLDPNQFSYFFTLHRCAIPVLAIALVVFGGLTIARNADYASDFAFWSDSLAKWSHSHRSENNLGLAFYQKGDADATMTHYRRALAIDPGYDQAHNNLGYALAEKGALDEAIACYEKALAIRPDYDRARNNLASALFQKGRVDEAITHQREALWIQPKNAKTHYNLGAALLENGRVSEAIAEFRAALEIESNYAKARDNLNKALRRERTEGR